MSSVLGTPQLNLTDRQFVKHLACQPGKESFNVEEACAVTGIKKCQLLQAIKRHELKAELFGQSYIITRSALRQYIGA